MRRRLVTFMAGFWIAVSAAAGPAQLHPGDLVLTYQDTATAGGRTLQLDPATGRVTTLIDKLPAPNTNLLGNWVEMGPGNRDVWVAHQESVSKGAVYVLDRAGTVATVHPLAWRTDAFRFTDDGGITWSGYGGMFTDRLIRTDRSFQNPTTLVTGLPSLSLSHQEIEDTGNYVAAFQSTSPDGGVAELDPVAGSVVQVVKGLAFTNTVDFHRGDGKVYAVEFGAPGKSSAPVGSLLAIDLGARKVVSLIDATTPAGALVDRLNWIRCTADHNLLLGARHKIFKFDLGQKTIVKTWTFEVDRLQAITGAAEYGSRPLALDTGGSVKPGGTVGIDLNFPHAKAPGASYYVACSSGLRPGVLIGSRWLDLRFDVFLFISANNLAPTVFRNFRGILDPSGHARASIAVPALTSLDGLRLFCGGLALVNGAAVVTNVEGFTIRK